MDQAAGETLFNRYRSRCKMNSPLLLPEFFNGILEFRDICVAQIS